MVDPLICVVALFINDTLLMFFKHIQLGLSFVENCFREFRIKHVSPTILLNSGTSFVIPVERSALQTVHRSWHA